MRLARFSGVNGSPTLFLLLRAALTCTLAAAFVAGCERIEYRAAPTDLIRSAWAVPYRSTSIPIAPSLREFLSEAAQSSLFEIEASRIALAHGGSPAVRRYAEATLRTRVSVDTDLGQLADSVGVALPTRLNDNLSARLAILEQLSGNDFDRAYARNVGVLVPEEALAAFERAANRQGERVQRFAADQIPTLRRQLELGRRLATELGKTDMA